MKKTAVEFKHTKVVSESGNELFFDKQGKLIKEEPKQQTAVEWLMIQLYKKGFIKEIDGNEPINLMNKAKELEKEQQGHSEEEVLNFTQTIIQQYKSGNTNIEQLDLLKETLQLFKK